VTQTAEAVSTGCELGSVEMLARFFPETTRVRVAAQVTVFRGPSTKLHETTVVEFASSNHAIFVSSLPLEFDDRLRLHRDRSDAPLNASVVAMHYYDGHKVVAVKLVETPSNWVTRP
jgi:hypothetical protein